MKLPKEAYWLGLLVFEGIDSRRFFLLKKHFGAASAIWLASAKKLEAAGLSTSLANNFLNFRKNFDLSSYYLRAKKRLIKIIIFDDKNYPKQLKEIAVPPILLLVRGEIMPIDVHAIAVVGTRKITPYGRQVTRKLVRGLVSHNITVVSGLARGVDSVAHRTALEFGGRTLAVLGSGLDVIYPPENKNLAAEISSKGALISEFSLATKPNHWNFPQRNRIISGLSLGVLVTEGASRSGTKITANYAAQQNRKVFAVAGSIDAPMSEGPADLIKMGAKMVTKVEDILKEVKLKKIKGLSSAVFKEPASSAASFAARGRGSAATFAAFSKEEKRILKLLQKGQQHIDEITRRTALSPASVASTLTMLEIKARVKNLGGGRYCLIT